MSQEAREMDVNGSSSTPPPYQLHYNSMPIPFPLALDDGPPPQPPKDHPVHEAMPRHAPESRSLAHHGGNPCSEDGRGTR